VVLALERFSLQTFVSYICCIQEDLAFAKTTSGNQWMHVISINPGELYIIGDTVWEALPATNLERILLKVGNHLLFDMHCLTDKFCMSYNKTANPNYKYKVEAMI
jgi:hypothetical protein